MAAVGGRLSSAVLLLLNMAGALLAPRGALSPAPPAAGAEDDAEDFFFFPFLVLYKSGRVQRFMGTDTVPASTDPATGVASRDVAVDAAAGLAVRLYLPSLATNSTAAGAADGGGRLPLLVFYHGGAFVTESASSPTYHRYLNALASRARVLAVSVEYHLAPERRLPTAYDDAWAALRWALASARRSPGPGGDPCLSRHADPARFFFTGDSAGGRDWTAGRVGCGEREHKRALMCGVSLLEFNFLEQSSPKHIV